MTYFVPISKTPVTGYFLVPGLLLLGGVARPQGLTQIPSAEYTSAQSSDLTPAHKTAARRDAGMQLLSFETGAEKPKAMELGKVSADEWKALQPEPLLPVMGIERKADGPIVDAGEWSALPDGRRVWRVAIHSQDAAGIRVQFTDFAVSNGAVWVHGGSNDQVFGPYAGNGPDDSSNFWSNTVFAESVVVEYQPYDNTNSAVPFSIGKIAHLLNQPLDSPGEQSPAAPHSCLLDVSCYAGWNPIASGTGKALFQRDGATYWCTGSLLNNTNKDFKPYFLTANHCITTPEDAASLEVLWNYQTTSCYATGPDALMPTARSLGARLLASNGFEQGEFSLLLLNNLPNVPLTFYGWNGAADALQMGDRTAGISHPMGLPKKISFGMRTTDGDALMGDSFLAADDYFQILHTQGRIEPGSSGSALFNQNNLVVGLLSYAPVGLNGDACPIDPFVAGYSRFSAALKSLAPYLSPGKAVPDLTPSPYIARFAGRLDGSSASFFQTSQTFTLTTNSTAPVSFHVSTVTSSLQLGGTTDGSVSREAPAAFTVSPATDGSYSAGLTWKTITITSDGGLTQTVVVETLLQ